jgi:hypothetical protein
MFSNDKLRRYLFFFLAFSVLSSKNILIYNEETLVALSFFGFVFFVLHYFGNSIKESLNERSQVIREELQNFLLLKQRSYQELWNQHSKIGDLLKATNLLHTFTKNQLNFLNTSGEKSLKNLFASKISNKLKTLVFSKLMVQQKLQYLLGEKILSNVLVAFPKKRGAVSAYQSKVLQEAIESLVVDARQKL